MLQNLSIYFSSITGGMQQTLSINGNMLGSVRYFSWVRYCILPSAVWCGAVHTFSHTRIPIVECRAPEREVGGSKPTAAVLCPWARHFTPLKYWLITQEAVAPSRHDWKIVDWDVKPQHKQEMNASEQSTACNSTDWSWSWKTVEK